MKKPTAPKNIISQSGFEKAVAGPSRDQSIRVTAEPVTQRMEIDEGGPLREHPTHEVVTYRKERMPVTSEPPPKGEPIRAIRMGERFDVRQMLNDLQVTLPLAQLLDRSESLRKDTRNQTWGSRSCMGWQKSLSAIWFMC